MNECQEGETDKGLYKRELGEVCQTCGMKEASRGELSRVERWFRSGEMGDVWRAKGRGQKARFLVRDMEGAWAGQNVYMSCDLRYGTGERQETRDKRDRKRKGREKKYENWCLGVYMEPKVW